MSRRWWLFLAALLLLGWLAWPRQDSATPVAATGARPAPLAHARRAALAPASAQPADPSFGARRTGIAACDDLVDRTIGCAQLPDDAKIAVAEASKAWARVGQASRRDLEDSCRATAAVQGDALAAMGC